jgi:DNA ligase D-like protein (predicted ligase)
MARTASKTARPASPKQSGRPRTKDLAEPPRWVEPQLCKLVEKAPSGAGWVHEVKFDGYRMAARIVQGNVQLLTRSGLDWTSKYPQTAAALSKLPAKTAYIDGELCAVRPDGVTSFALMQAATDGEKAAPLTYYAFDLLLIDGTPTDRLPLNERKARLAAILRKPPRGVACSEHFDADGEQVRKAACEHGLEGIVSKRVDRAYLPGNRGVWVKCKCLNRAEFVVVGWSDPEGSRTLIGSLLLGYYTPDSRLMYAGRVGTGMSQKTLRMLYERLEPLAVSTMPLDVRPPRRSRYGSPLELSRVHWVRPQLVAEVTYMTWTDDGLLRHTVFIGLREDKPASEVRREIPSVAS